MEDASATFEEAIDWFCYAKWGSMTGGWAREVRAEVQTAQRWAGVVNADRGHACWHDPVARKPEEVH